MATESSGCVCLVKCASGEEDIRWGRMGGGFRGSENFQVTSSGIDNAYRTLVTTHRSYDSHLPVSSFVRERDEGEASDDDVDSDQSSRCLGGEVATSSGVMCSVASEVVASMAFPSFASR